MYGLSNKDVEAFLNLDVTKEPLAQNDIRTFQKLQQKFKAVPTQDPRVQKAMSQMRGALGAQMEALGVYGRTESNKDDYDQLTGAMSAALDAWADSHGKPATPRDVIDTIAPQLLKQRVAPAFIHSILFPNLFTTKKPFFQVDIPESFSEKLDKDTAARGEPAPTEAEKRRIYQRALLNDLYGKKKAQ